MRLVTPLREAPIELTWPEPLILLATAHWVPTAEYFDVYLRRLGDILDEGRPYVSVFEYADRIGGATNHRRRYAAWIRERAAELSSRCLGLGFVVYAPVARFMFSSSLRFQKLPSDYAVLETREDALVWARGRLERVGLRASG